MNSAETSIATKSLSIDAIRSKVSSPGNNLAMLPKGFGRFTQMLSKEILRITSTAPNFSFAGFCRTDALAAKDVEENSCLSELLICGDLRQSMRITVERPIVFGICDLVFGGVGNEPAFVETRPFSKIERAVMQLFFKVIGRSLPAAFTNIALKEFFLAPPQDPNEDPLYPPFKPFVSVKILCNMHGYSGELLIEMPEELTTLFRPLDEENRTQSVPAVSEWGAQISTRVENIEVELTVVLAELQMSLDNITSFHAGQLIRLESDIGSPVTVCSEGVKLFNAKLGQAAKKFCLSFEAPIALPN